MEYVLTLQRKPLYYIHNLVIPCILQMVIILSTFFLPLESGERIGVVITIILVFAVYLQVRKSYHSIYSLLYQYKKGDQKFRTRPGPSNKFLWKTYQYIFKYNLFKNYSARFNGGKNCVSATHLLNSVMPKLYREIAQIWSKLSPI